MTNKKIKTALIGLGNIGLKYDYYNKNIISHAKAISKNKNLRFMFAVDKINTKVNQFKKKYKIPASNEINSLVKRYKPIFIIIAVKKEQNYQLINSLKKYKFIKYILIEKPGAKNFLELKKIINVCKKNKILLFINYNRTFQNKYTNICKEFRTSKKFKSVYLYNRGLYNNCSHYINLLSQFIYKPKKISILKKNPKWNNDIQPDVKIEYKNGEIFLINIGVKNIHHNQFILITNKTKVVSDNSFGNLNIYKKNYDSHLFKKTINVEQKYNQKHTLKSIVSLIKSKKKVDKLLTSYKATIQILDKIKLLNNKT